MEQMGMTDAQWKDSLRNQLENWLEERELVETLEGANKEKALQRIDKNIERIRKSLED